MTIRPVFPYNSDLTSTARVTLIRRVADMFHNFLHPPTRALSPTPPPRAVSPLEEGAFRCRQVLQDIRTERASARKAQASKGARVRREEIKQFLLELAAHTPPQDHTGAHLSDVLQVPDLMHMIMRDFECRRHNLRPGETPNLKVLAMRYGVTEDAIRRCNNLEDRSLPIARSFLYIPNAATSSAKDRRAAFDPARFRTEVAARQAGEGGGESS